MLSLAEPIYRQTGSLTFSGSYRLPLSRPAGGIEVRLERKMTASRRFIVAEIPGSKMLVPIY